jgi:UDP-2-acetamido-3-amino-2,3-dideoxy-glucuronate N-acetyltransferase
MAVFDDTRPTGKLRIHDKGFHWTDGVPIPRDEAEVVVEIDDAEPLRRECEHFLACVTRRTTPVTDGISALSVLGVLEASQRSMDQGGVTVQVSDVATPARV